MASVDQTPLPFIFTDGPAYENQGAKTVWVQGRSSVLVLREIMMEENYDKFTTSNYI